ncbi:MAG: hypothetical protein GTO08_05710, partial [Deltaproteobacteria bacterium]|nr:hypothetical protein [Deltaproteobacteria bacterium]
MTRNKPLFINPFRLALLAAFLFSCGMEEGKVVSYLGNSVTREEVLESAREWEQIDDFDQFRNRVRELALVEEFSRRAKEVGLDKTDGEVKRKMLNFQRKKLSGLYAEKVIGGKIQVTAEDLEKALGDKVYEDTVVVKALIPKSKGKIADILKAVEAGEDFPSLLEQYGTDTGKRTGGQIGHITRSNAFFQESEREYVFSHATGEVFGPVMTGIGEAFILVEERHTAGQIRAMAEEKARPMVRREKMGKAMRRAVEELKERYKVVVYDEEGKTMRQVRGSLVPVLAEVGDVIITGMDASGVSHHQSMDRERILNRIIAETLFMKEAQRLGLDSDERFRREYRARLDLELYSAYKSYVYNRPVSVTGDELRTFYDDNREDLFYKYKEASYLVMKGVEKERLGTVMASAKNIQGKSDLSLTADKLGLEYDLVLRQKEKDIPVASRGTLLSRKEGEVFEVELPDGLYDVYRIIHVDLEESFPEFEDIKPRVEKALMDSKRMAQLNAVIEGEIAKVNVNETSVKEVYGVYRKSINRTGFHK